MLKGKLAILCLVAISLLVVNGTASAGIIDPCTSYWQLHATVTPAPYFACPTGDTPSFLNQGWWIWICVLESDGTPVPGVPPQDFWFIDCDPLRDLTLCGAAASATADSLTNAAGMTTMTNGTLSAGGCADGLALVIQGFVVQDSLTNCTSDFCCPINVRSPDISGDLLVDLVDLAVFGGDFPPNPYDTCSDFDLSGGIDLVDLAVFAFHFGPPGHSCN